jgi:hypothetical protein
MRTALLAQRPPAADRGTRWARRPKPIGPQLIQRGDDADAVARATFLRGLIADDRGDEAGLAAAAATLKPTTPPLEADSAELAARLALRRSDPVGAKQQAIHAAELRQAILDYRGLARPWPSKEQRLSAAATRPRQRISFFVPGAALPRRATRIAPVRGSAGPHLSPLAKGLVAMQPAYCAASAKTAVDGACLSLTRIRWLLARPVGFSQSAVYDWARRCDGGR